MAFRATGRAGVPARLGGLLLLVSVLVIVVAVPIGLLAGVAGAYWSGVRKDGLPQQVLEPVTDQVTRVYASDGRTLIASFYDEDRHDIGLAQIAPVMRQAIVAAEDVRFYQHGGVDPKGVLRALVADAGRGGARQGASTLTMQLIRNALKNDPKLTP
ncbi:biosynthetic peptidoglycan transglycosylase, partial [Actinoplanes sp. NPDC051633]|uniref:biosynthetic peptidoglycan transglycosylase n=1 Tax=Actinoplanes sp. NPDC051633 TaxID=3155670 RepID=UPI00343F35C4